MIQCCHNVPACPFTMYWEENHSDYIEIYFAGKMQRIDTLCIVILKFNQKKIDNYNVCHIVSKNIYAADWLWACQKFQTVLKFKIKEKQC